MEVSDNLMQHIKAELEKLEYGSVTIEVVNGRSMDVTTSVRKRFGGTKGEPESSVRVILRKPS